MRNKLIGIIGFDMLVAFTPLLSGVSPDLVDWVSYFLIGMPLVTMMVLMSSDEESDTLKKIELERRAKPKWWNLYDLLSDILFVSIWLFYGYYVVVFLLILMKIVTFYTVPNYYKGA